MFKRYAVYYTPVGELAIRGAHWLGWDIATGQRCDHPDLPDLDPEALTAGTRRYGMHATIKPPLRLLPDQDANSMSDALAGFCAREPAVTLDGLRVARVGSFLALVPEGEQDALAMLSCRAVRDLDRFRAPPDAAELARRRSETLSAAQERNLNNWGYPFLMDQFRFHITLTRRLDDAHAAQIQDPLAAHFAPVLPAPFVLDSLSLVGEDETGYFHEIERFKLAG